MSGNPQYTPGSFVECDKCGHLGGPYTEAVAQSRANKHNDKEHGGEFNAYVKTEWIKNP